MFRFYGKLLLQAPRLLWDSAKLWVEIAGVYTVAVGIVGLGTLSFPPVWALVPIALFFLYGLLKANYLRHTKVQKERDRLQDEKETDEKRAAIGERLSDLYHEGVNLRTAIVNSTDETPVSECDEELRKWRKSVIDYLMENASTGKAQYVDGVTSVPAVTRPGMKSQATRDGKETIVSHQEERMKRLAEVTREY